MRCLVLLAVLALPLAAQPSAKSYPLPTPPLVILDQLADLKSGDVPKISADEQKFLADTWEARSRSKIPTAADDPAILPAFLFASGVEVAEQKPLVAKLDTIVIAAKEATAMAKTSPERGELLMKHLHATTMKAGYEAKQGSLAVLLETGKFNGVSATALYYLVGSRLGMKLQPIAIPGGLFLDGHVALDLIEGPTRIQVEPTGPDGFDYEAKIKRPGVVIGGPKPDRKKAIDVDPLALAAMAYSNRGGEHIKAEPPRRLDALRCYLSALAIDPLNASAANNFSGVFVNWGSALLKENKTEDALCIVRFGRKARPDSRELREAQGRAWEEHIDAALKANKDAEAIEFIQTASKELPESGEFKNPATSFVRYGWKVFEEKGAEAALPIAERGMKLIEGKQAEELRDWRSGIYRRWSQQLLEKKDLDASLKVITQAHAHDKGSRNIQEGICYHLQEALRQADATGGIPAATVQYQAVVKAFPDVADVAEVAESYARRGARELAEKKMYAEALKRLTDYAALLPKPEQKADAAAAVYDAWARALGDEKKWEASLEKYAEGLKLYPGHVRLTNNAAVVIDRWADGAYKAEMWDEAIRIYQVGLKMLPDHPGLKYNLKICEDRKKRK